jgi:hypothetical protein
MITVPVVSWPLWRASLLRGCADSLTARQRNQGHQNQHQFPTHTSSHSTVTTRPRPRVQSQLQPIPPAEPEKRIVYGVLVFSEVKSGKFSTGHFVPCDLSALHLTQPQTRTRKASYDLVRERQPLRFRGGNGLRRGIPVYCPREAGASMGWGFNCKD